MNDDDARPLPEWIPRGAADVYFRVKMTGACTPAVEKLFRSESLRCFWSRIGDWSPDKSEAWSFLVGEVMAAEECVPADGASTRKAPSSGDKLMVRDRQTEADRLRKRAAKKARELEGLLRQMVNNGGVIPDEVGDGLALIEAAISRVPRRDPKLSAAFSVSAYGANPFAAFKRSLSSRARLLFPRSVELVAALGDSLEQFPPARDVFADSPWLASNKVTWRDGLRRLVWAFDLARHCYGDFPAKVREVEWLNLTRAILNPDAGRDDVRACLKVG